MKRWLVGLSCSAALALAAPGEGQTRPAPKAPPKARTLPDGWIEAAGEARLAHVTPEEAKAKALQAAREEAISHALGIDISSLDYLSRQEEGASVREGFLSFSRQTSAGRIVAERSVAWESYEVPGDPLPILVYRARIQAQVERQEGRPDPGFSVSVSLNKETFVSGDAIELAITATRPCHVTVVNVTAVDTVVVILPHQYRPSSFVAPGDTLRVPDAEEKAMGIHYEVTVPEGRRRVEEYLKVIALKTARPLGAGWRKRGVYNRVPTRQAALEHLMRWLVRIPREEWTEADAAYTVQTAEP